ncbi:MAG: acyl-CoA synthetase [Acidimicrobiales bacterium]|nr:acyl-CoA synthetase [Acidimicrobiales bacterium]
MAFNLADFIEHTVDAVPDRAALVCEDRRLTYAELEDRANRLAHHLAARGIGERDHVAIYSYNSLEYVEAMLAAYKLRAVPINVNYRYVADELTYILDNSDAKALVFQAQFSPLVAEVAPKLPVLDHLLVVDDGTGTEPPVGAVDYEEALAARSPERDFEPRSDDDIYILYTGGTTGYPKGVVWRHEDVWRVLGGGIDFMTGERIEDEYQMSEQAAEAEPSVGLVLAPLMHGAAQWGTLGGLIRGMTSVLLTHFDADDVWKAVETHGIGGIAITGDAMAIPLLDALEEGDYDVGSLVSFSSTAAVFSPTVKDRLFELLPNVFVTEAVGSTEGGFNGIRLIEKGKTRPDNGGLINVDMGPDTLVIDDDGNPVSPGETGKLARGGNVPIEYYKDPEKSAETFITVDGKRYSVPGDFARLETDGTMTLLGRGSQSINSGGEKIFPEEVEGALKAHPRVFDALVIGLPDERWGQKVAAVVEPRPGESPTLDELDEHCRTKIAGYKVPRELFLVDAMPRHPSGKPDYRRARAVAEGAGT